MNQSYLVQQDLDVQKKVRLSDQFYATAEYGKNLLGRDRLRYIDKNSILNLNDCRNAFN